MTTMNRNKRAPMGAAAVIGLLFAGGLQAGVFFDFNDGSLQGWTDLTVAGTHDGPRNWAGAPPAFPGAGHDGTPGLGQNLVGGNQDSTHPVLWLRSPEFTLDGSGDLSVWLRGGTGSGSLAGQPESVVPAASTAPGFQGVALRDAATGVFVLSGRKAANGDHWENIVFSAAQLAALDQGATYTLDLIDAGHGGWGWATMDTVSISYSSVPPWPQLAAGAGVSLQLIDSSQGAHHIGNWASSASTPGHPNSVARPLPLFPNFYINEIQTLNLTGPLDPTGSRGPWVELYHDDQVALSLDGFFLSDDPTDLTKWPFPSAAAMPAASFRMVWLDGRDHLTTADNWHSGFLLTAPADTLTLSRIVDGVPLVISHRAFPVLPGNTSYGPWPDGSEETFLFPVATPGAPNANPSPQVAEVVMPRFMQGAVPNTGRVRCRPRRCHRRARRGRVEPRRLRAAGGRPPVRPAGRRHRGRVRTLGH